MGRLDIGLGSFEQAQAVFQQEIDRANSHIWVCDWITVSFLDKINFVSDATMYRLYCDEYDIPCDYNDEECTELANKYNKQLIKYQIDLLGNIVVNIYDRWVKEVTVGNVSPKLPPTAKTALINFISIVRRMAESEYFPHFMSMFGSLSEAHKEKTSCTFDVSDVQENITKEQFISYCDIVKKILVRPFQQKDEESDMKLFNTRIIIAQKILMSILWMCEGNNNGRSYSADVLFDRYIHSLVLSDTIHKDYIDKYVSRKSIPMAYAICLTPESIDIIPEDSDSYPVTDSFRLMTTLLYTNNAVRRD